MLLPRFSIRVLLIVLTVCAFAFVIVGTAVRGQNWAWGVSLALLSLVLTALVHATWFGIMWLFAQMPSAQPKEARRAPK